MSEDNPTGIQDHFNKLKAESVQPPPMTRGEGVVDPPEEEANDFLGFDLAEEETDAPAVNVPTGSEAHMEPPVRDLTGSPAPTPTPAPEQIPPAPVAPTPQTTEPAPQPLPTAPVTPAAAPPLAPATHAAPPQPVTPVPSQQIPTAGFQPQQAPPPAVPQAPPASAQPPQPATPESATPAQVARTPQEVFQAIQQNREQIVGKLTDHFKLTEEQVAEFEQNPGEAIPKLAANLYLETASNLWAQFMQAMPTLVAGFAKQHAEQQRYEGEFYKAWPDLKPDAHGNLVANVAAMYRNMYPTAPSDQLIRDVGSMVMARVQAEQQALAATAAATNAAVNGIGANPIPNGGAAPQPAFAPAAYGSPGGPPPSQPQYSNPFEEMDAFLKLDDI